MSSKSRTTKTVICDRCGKEWELKQEGFSCWENISRLRFIGWLRAEHGDDSWRGRKLDLCPDCNWEFRKWIKGYDNENMSSTYKLLQIANDRTRSDEEKVIDIFTELGCELVDVTNNAEGMYLKRTLNNFKKKLENEKEKDE